MTYTFTEDEIKIFLNWSVYAQGEKSHLEPEEEQMIRRLNKIVRKDFDELSDEDKVYRFCEENEYPIGWYSPAYSSGDHNIYFQFEKEGKEPKIGLWEKFCKYRGIELKCMDIHKDNPTLIYCP